MNNSHACPYCNCATVITYGEIIKVIPQPAAYIGMSWKKDYQAYCPAKIIRKEYLLCLGCHRITIPDQQIGTGIESSI